jgi:quinol-cytochrome oxidoreductase complex cytochrome b subunit
MYAQFLRPEQKEVRVSKWIRQFHRWAATAFTLGVIVNTVVIFMGAGAQPSYWVYLLALIPLFLLMLSGLYLFVLPYAARWRSARTAA